MKAYIDRDGVLHVEAQTNCERYALKYNNEHFDGMEGIVIHEKETVNPLSGGVKTDHPITVHGFIK